MKFEEALSKLEDIISNLERGEVDLEHAIALYDEGIKLQKHCADKLQDASLRIKKIVLQNGDIKLENI